MGHMDKVNSSFTRGIRLVWWWSLGLGSILGAASLIGANPSPIAAWTYGGPPAWQATPHAGQSLRQILAQKETQHLLHLLIQKTARAFAQWLAPQKTNHQALLQNHLQSSLTALLHTRWAGMVWQPDPKKGYSWALIIQPSPQKLAFWTRTWNTLAQTLQLSPRTTHSQQASFTWIQLSRPSAYLWYAQEKNSVTFGFTPALSFLTPKVLSFLKSLLQQNQSSPQAPWLTGQISLGQLLSSCSRPPYGWPTITFRLIPSRQKMRLTATIRFPKPVPWTSPAWNVPTNLIREPLVSFTALRGMQDFLRSGGFLSQTPFHTPPNHFYAWSVGNLPFGSYCAFDAPWSTNQLASLAPWAEKQIKQTLPGLERIRAVYQPRFQRLIISNLLFAIPFLAPAPKPHTNFYVAGLSLPLVVKGDPPPPGLLAQLNQDSNLIYYHWELTSRRLPHLFLAQMFYYMYSGFLAPPPQGAINGWITRTNIQALLGNTATKILRVDSQTFQLIRSSTTGLSAWELLLLCNWIDGKQFPRWTPPQRPALPHKPPSTPTEPQRIQIILPSSPPSSPPPSSKPPTKKQPSRLPPSKPKQ